MADELDLLWDGPKHASRTIALAHGAGAAMDTPFMQFFADGLAKRGWRVARFEFPYMAARRQGLKRPPDREPVLRATWLRVVEAIGPRGVIGGKSMGGRIASLVADEADALGLVCLGYPFHPVGQPERLRVEHLRTIRTQALIVQGERDPFGDRQEVETMKLSPNIRVAWLPDGDHGFKPRKSSGRTQEQNWDAALEEMARFVTSLK